MKSFLHFGFNINYKYTLKKLTLAKLETHQLKQHMIQKQFQERTHQCSCLITAVSQSTENLAVRIPE